MASWTNATTRIEPSGLLRPVISAERSGLRREYPIDPALEPFVERYWSVRWDHRGREPFRSEVLTHASVNLSVEEGDAPRHGVTLPAVLVHGLISRRFVIDLHGWGRVTAAKFRPGGWTAMTGQRAGRDTVRRFPTEFGNLIGTVFAGDEDAVRVAALDAALAPLAPEPDPEFRFLSEVLALMEVRRDLTRVDQVAAATGTSVRALQRLFRHYVGLGPKAVLARHRVRDAAALIDAGEGDDLAGLALDLGWFDQAHFSRDFRAAVGVTPSSYLAAARRVSGA